MKTSGSLIGGRLIDDPRIYAAYARYFVRFVQAYERAGVPVYAVTVQNEPQNRNPSGYPGMNLPWRKGQADRGARPRAPAAGLDTKILGYDHNWTMHPGDIASTPPGEEPETEYAADLLSTDAGRWIAGTAFHCYSGDPSRQTTLRRAFPDKGIWFTECSGSHGPSDPPAQVLSDTLKWHARNLVLGVTRTWGKTVVNWNPLYTSADGEDWGDAAAATGAGAGQLTTIDIPATAARFLRVVQTRPHRSGGRSLTCGSTAEGSSVTAASAPERRSPAKRGASGGAPKRTRTSTRLSRTRPSTWRVYQFRHRRGARGV